MSDLVRALWAADQVPDTAEQVIRTYISRLRKILGTAGDDRSVTPAIITTVSQGYRLQIGPTALDLSRFQDRLAKAQQASRCGDQAQAIELLDGALGLWGGSSLAGVPGGFAESQRRYLDMLRLSGYEAKAAALVHFGAYGEAELLLEAMTDRHPLNERFRELQMLSLYRHGRQADALAVYRDAQKLLAEELAVDPGPGLQTVHEKILRSDPTLVPSGHVIAECREGIALPAEQEIAGPAYQPQALRRLNCPPTFSALSAATRNSLARTLF
jgi:DNA-binding SARP family transcriptional activator